MGIVQNHTTTIDGITYTTRTFPASEGLVLIGQIVTVLGQRALDLLMAHNDKSTSEILADPKILGALAITAAQGSEKLPGGLPGFCRDLLKYTEADRVQIGEAQGKGNLVTHFDTHFAGRYKHLMDVCIFVMRVGFANP